jgi:hypothetical protein
MKVTKDTRTCECGTNDWEVNEDYTWDGTIDPETGSLHISNSCSEFKSVVCKNCGNVIMADEFEIITQ